MFDWYNIQFYNNGETTMDITNQKLTNIFFQLVMVFIFAGSK